MDFLIPLMSLLGPIYFGIHGSSIVAVLGWAVIWTTLRFLATWRSLYVMAQHRDGDGSETWSNRHPYFVMLGVFIATLTGFVAVHATIYWIVWRSIQSWN